MEHSEALDQLATALAKAQASVKGAKKDSANPFFKSSYADLASVWEACREAFTSNGLSVVQFPGYENGEARLTTYLLHSSGQWMCGTAGAPLVKADPQGIGSALTYLRRYALAAVASVAPEDDDGNDASGRGRATPARQSAPSKPAPQPTPPSVQPMTEKPAALEGKDDMPWDSPVTAAPGLEELTFATPCPHNKAKKPVGDMDRGELLALQVWLVGHDKSADRADEWAQLVRAALTKTAFKQAAGK